MKGCFIFGFVSLPLDVTRPIYHTMCTKVAETPIIIIIIIASLVENEGKIAAESRR